MSRVRRVNNQREMELLADDFITRGYKVISEGNDNIRLKAQDWGSADTHIVIAVVSGWWTLGLSNVLYAIYSYVTAEEIVVKIDDGINADE
jgi:hypothetical protein